MTIVGITTQSFDLYILIPAGRCLRAILLSPCLHGYSHWTYERPRHASEARNTFQIPVRAMPDYLQLRPLSPETEALWYSRVV